MVFRILKRSYYPLCWIHAIYVRNERKVFWRFTRFHVSLSKSPRAMNWSQIQVWRCRNGWRESWPHEQQNLITNCSPSPSTNVHSNMRLETRNLMEFTTGRDNAILSCLTANCTDQGCCRWFQLKSEPQGSWLPTEESSYHRLHQSHRHCHSCVKGTLKNLPQAVSAPQSPSQFQVLLLHLHSHDSVLTRQLHPCLSLHHHWHFTGKLRQLHTCMTPARSTLCKQGAQYYCTQHHNQNEQLNLSDVSTFRFNPRKRIPLAYADEINQVVEDHVDVIHEFAEALGCTEAEMRDMVRHDTRLVTMYPKHEVILKMRLLLQHGFPASEIVKKYQLFSRSVSHIQSCLLALESVKRYRHPLSMLLLSGPRFQSRLAKYQQEVAIMGPGHANQASFVAELLECSQEELETLVLDKKCNFLLTLSPSRLKEMVNLLASFGVSADMIREQPGMLRCSFAVAVERLRRAQSEGVLQPRLIPYILTNSDSHIDVTLVYWRRNIQALRGYSDERQLLMDRLECSEMELESLLRRKPLVRAMKSSKLKDCLDVLLEEMGLAPEVVLRHGELLHFSPHRLRARWAVLQPLGLPELALVKDVVLPERKFVVKYGFSTS